MTRIRRSGFQSRGPRRIVNWGAGPQATPETLSASATQIWTDAAAPNAGNFTIVRIRGYINYYLRTTSQVAGGFEIASGIYMMTEDAFAVGDTAALDPIDDANSDMWIWHSFADVHSITATIADGVNAQCCVMRQEIDSKAMRKDFDTQRILVGVTQAVEVGTSVMDVWANTRILLKQ